MGPGRRTRVATLEQPDTGAYCCPRYHEAVELVGKRWTGAILYVLLHGGRLRFTEIAQAVPDLSDRLLSERMKELEARGVVARTVESGPPVRVTYELTDMGRGLEPAVTELRHGTLTLPTLERIALAVAEHYHSDPGTAMHSRTARQAGLAPVVLGDREADALERRQRKRAVAELGAEARIRP